MIKYSHHYKYCNSISYSSKVQLKGRHNLVETFEFLKRSKELGPIEYYTPEMFKNRKDFEDKIKQMKIEIGKDGCGNPETLPVFTGEGGWGYKTRKFNPEEESITCIVKAPEWLKDIHGSWIIFFQDKKTGEIRMGVNGGHLATEQSSEGKKFLEGLSEKLNYVLTSKRIKQICLEQFTKIAKDVTFKQEGSKLKIHINVKLSEAVKAGGIISRHRDVPVTKPVQLNPQSKNPFKPQPQVFNPQPQLQPKFK